ncbi:MFS transporter [Sphaerisporangium fuscum]|uniref:MFS transporter n=1 Tax=Sphaerisporangium fuscum TaxID=2835868 RepID=UPI001BDC2622|nr:MFS transporter [Sphaerisporangium fuscum]
MSVRTTSRDTSPRRGALALPVIAAAQLLMVMDGTIVTVGLPNIGRGLGMAEADLSWVLTSYSLAFGGLLLPAGRAGDLFGRRRLFRVGLVMFIGASLLGGLAPNGEVLIAARALQGITAAMIAPAALSLLADAFPAGPRRDKALGLYGAMGGLGSVVGLLLGGALTEYLGWRWIMFVNVPIALAILLGTTALPPGTRDRGGLDLPGGITATLGLVSLIYMINRVGGHGWGETLTIASAVTAAALLLVFVVIQRRARHPMLPSAVLADRGRLGATLIMFLMGGGMLATFYFLTLYMQAINHYPPMLTGVAYLPMAVSIGVGSGVIGPNLQAATSARTLTVTAMAVSALGMAWFSLLAPGQSPWVVLLPAQVVVGVGLGMGFVACTIAGVRGVARQQTGIASGLINTSQQVGGAFGLALLAGLATRVSSGRPPGTPAPEALTAGYTAGLLAGVVAYLTATLVATLTLTRREAEHSHEAVRLSAGINGSPQGS